MLRILSIDGKDKPNLTDTGNDLYRTNPTLNLVIEAPMYWWLDCEFERFNFIFPKNGLRFCTDAWESSSKEINSFINLLGRTKNFSDRQIMQILPLSTIITGKVFLSYQKIVEICENYCCGEYAYQELRNQWPTEREWADFCETLLDIRGVRTLVEVRA